MIHRAPTVHRGASQPKILFTGYAPVHFLCFRPLYERLTAAGLDVSVSGGIRTRTNGTTHYDGTALYGPLGVPAGSFLPVEEVRERDFDLVFAANTKMILPRHSGARIQIFHGISFRNKAIRLENAGADYFFMVGPYMTRRFAETGIILDGDPRAVPVGFMKTDRLVDGTLHRGPLLHQFDLDGTRPILLYAPTGQKYNSLETMGEEVIRRLSQSGQFDLLIKLHDHPKNRSVDWRARLDPLLDDHVQIVTEPDVIPLLFLADLLITDASSVSNEYSLLDRPIVFLDVPRLLKRAGKPADSMVDLETWGRRGGFVVEQPEGILLAVEDGLTHPERFSDVRLEMVADLFFNPGLASEVALGWLRDHLL